MTISFILKRSKAGFSMDDSLNGATIYVRLRDGRLLDSTVSTGETVNPLWWDAKREEIKANIVCDNKEKAELNEKLQDLKKFLYSKHKVDKEKGKVNKEWLAKALKEYAPELGKMASRTVDKSHSFSDRFQKFLDANEFSEGRINQYRVIERAVLRFEEFIRTTKRGRKNFAFDIRTVDENDLNDLYDFMSKEHIYYEEYPEIYEKFPEKRQSKPRGANTLSENFKKLRAFFNWAQSEGIIRVSPFSKFKCEKELY